MIDHDKRLIAILRGVLPSEIEGIVDALVEAGFRAIEVPLNSPDALRSIELAAKRAPDDCLIGAGTVLDPVQVEDVARAGGRVIVSPNCDLTVIKTTRQLGLLSYPGVFTATEALLAIKSGANALKFFPANLLGPGGIKALRAVLPAEMPCYAVGGVEPADFADYFAVGCAGFGLGSSLYKPGVTAAEVATKARVCMEALS